MKLSVVLNKLNTIETFSRIGQGRYYRNFSRIGQGRYYIKTYSRIEQGRYYIETFSRIVPTLAVWDSQLSVVSVRSVA